MDDDKKVFDPRPEMLETITTHEKLFEDHFDSCKASFSVCRNLIVESMKKNKEFDLQQYEGRPGSGKAAKRLDDIRKKLGILPAELDKELYFGIYRVLLLNSTGKDTILNSSDNSEFVERNNSEES